MTGPPLPTDTPHDRPAGPADAETGHRGFRLTGAERYLEPCNVARANLAPSLRCLRGAAARVRLPRTAGVAAVTRA